MIQFEKFNHELELNEQRKLFVECFPENIGSPVVSVQHYKWKFHSINKKESSFEYVAKINNEIVGYYAALPYTYLIDDVEVEAGMVCDVMTGIKARGRGVFTKLGVYSTDQFKNEGLAFSTGYPIRQEVIPGHKKAGWDYPFEIPMYGYFLSLNSFLRNKTWSLFIPIANLFLGILKMVLWPISYSSKKGFTIEKYASSEISKIERFDDFIGNWQIENKICLKKNKEFLKWRLGAPEKNYTILVLKKEQAIIGYTIFREVEKEGVPCIGILDFSFLNKYNKNAGILLSAIKSEAKAKKVELLLIMLMKEKAKHFNLLRNGFLKTPYSFLFIIKPYIERYKATLFDRKNWNLMWIDSDDL